MALITSWFFFNGLFCTSLVYLIYYVYWELTVGAARRRLIKQHVCKPIKRLPTRDRLLGLDHLWAYMKRIKEHKILQGTQEHFTALGTNTLQFVLLGQTKIATIEPENVKSVLASEFRSYSLGDGRKKLLVPLLGEGIFTTDGAAWQHSREMLRPCFVRSKLVDDLEMFERHVEYLIQAIPRDGSCVDLQELFFQFTLDLGTFVLMQPSLLQHCQFAR